MDAMEIAETGSAQDRTPRYAMATRDHHPDQPRTEPELRAQRLGFALNSLAAELVTERRKSLNCSRSSSSSRRDSHRVI